MSNEDKRTQGIWGRPVDQSEFDRNNPKHEPVGHFTGRCARCGSKDLWDDNLAYGCNKCGALLGGN